MVETWTVWLSIVGASVATAAGAAYVILRAQSRIMRERLMLLERELALGRARLEYNERKLSELLEAIIGARQSAEEQLGRLREKVEALSALMLQPLTIAGPDDPAPVR